MTSRSSQVAALIESAIRRARDLLGDEEWRVWADRWLSGSDRSRVSADSENVRLQAAQGRLHPAEFRARFLERFGPLRARMEERGWTRDQVSTALVSLASDVDPQPTPIDSEGEAAQYAMQAAQLSTLAASCYGEDSTEMAQLAAGLALEAARLSEEAATKIRK